MTIKHLFLLFLPRAVKFCSHLHRARVQLRWHNCFCTEEAQKSRCGQIGRERHAFWNYLVAHHSRTQGSTEELPFQRRAVGFCSDSLNVSTSRNVRSGGVTVMLALCNAHSCRNVQRLNADCAVRGKPAISASRRTLIKCPRVAIHIRFIHRLPLTINPRLPPQA